MNIFQRLREDHDKQRLLIQSLLQTHGDSCARRDIYDSLKQELQAHAVAEERHFYVPLIGSDLMQEKSRHAIAEHHEMDELLADLDEIDNASSAWLIKAKKLSEKIHHHLEDEEHEFFQLAGKVLTPELKESLSDDFIAEKQNFLKTNITDKKIHKD